MGKVSSVLRSIGLATMGQSHKRRILALDKEFENLEQKVASLEAKNLHLQAQVNPLERQLKQLKERLDSLTRQSKRRPSSAQRIPRRNFVTDWRR